MHACSRSMGTAGLERSWGGCSDSWGRTRRGLGMHFPFSFITKRVDVSMGCQGCESHKSVMAAVAACSGAHVGPGREANNRLWQKVGQGCSPRRSDHAPDVSAIPRML